MNQKGFTLIELVMVIVLIGILAVIAVPQLGDMTGMKAGAFADKLEADIRYAQNLAMTRNIRHRVYFNAAPAPTPNGYAVTNNAGAVVEDLSVVLNTGDFAGITVASPFPHIEFDSLGRPYNDAGALLAADASITVSPGFSITIKLQTGAVNKN
jgi:MSHA pilin protein MshC